MNETNGFKTFMFVGGIIGGVLGAIALIHSMVYIPLKGDISDLNCKIDTRYDEQIKMNTNVIASLARIEERLGISVLGKIAYNGK